MSEARVSLVTVTFNSAATLRHFWADWPREAYEWIVVDNCSTDDSVAVAESLGARVLRLSDNAGFSAANNVGARMATGDVLGFLNPDVTATRAGIERLGSIALSASLLVAPQLVNQDGTLQENGRGAPYPGRKLAHMFAPASTMNERYVRHVRSGIEQVVWVMGAALFASRSTFEKIGGWDAGFFIYYEDSDICLRALQQGVLTFVDGDVRFVHGWARETANGKSPSVWKHEFRSAARFYTKHPHCLIPMGRRSRALKMAEGVEAR